MTPQEVLERRLTHTQLIFDSDVARKMGFDEMTVCDPCRKAMDPSIHHTTVHVTVRRVEPARCDNCGSNPPSYPNAIGRY